MLPAGERGHSGRGVPAGLGVPGRFGALVVFAVVVAAVGPRVAGGQRGHGRRLPGAAGAALGVLGAVLALLAAPVRVAFVPGPRGRAAPRALPVPPQPRRALLRLGRGAGGRPHRGPFAALVGARPVALLAEEAGRGFVIGSGGNRGLGNGDDLLERPVPDEIRHLIIVTEHALDAAGQLVFFAGLGQRATKISI